MNIKVSKKNFKTASVSTEHFMPNLKAILALLKIFINNFWKLTHSVQFYFSNKIHTLACGMHTTADQTAALLLLSRGWEKMRQSKIVFERSSSGIMEGITRL